MAWRCRVHPTHSLISTQLVTEFRPQREGVQLARAGRDRFCWYIFFYFSFRVDMRGKGLPQHRQINLYGGRIRFLIFFIFFIIRDRVFEG